MYRAKGATLARPTTPLSPYRRQFGEYLHKLRSEVYGETVREFGAHLGVSPAYLNRMELGTVNIPTRKTIHTMAEGLGVDADVLLVKAGLAPEGNNEQAMFEYISRKLSRLDPSLIPVVIHLIDGLAEQFPMRQAGRRAEIASHKNAAK